jgi:hypothetical protein
VSDGNKNNWSDSILVWVVSISIAVILFHGEPDIGDALREKALIWSGLKDQADKQTLSSDINQ